MYRFILLLCFIFAAVESHANRCAAEKIVMDADRVYSVSSFEEVGYFTALSRSGEVVWEVPFTSKILNWTLGEGQILIFSKDRKGNANYITCIDSATGTLVWEKTIWAPASASASDQGAEA